MPKALVTKGNTKTLDAWSFSVYTNYIACPLRIFFEKILKIKIIEPSNPHSERGNRVHIDAEQYVREVINIEGVDASLLNIKPTLDLLKKDKAKVENEWAFTRTWKNTGWFDNDCWLRIKVDAFREVVKDCLVHIVDYKTGNIKVEEHRLQRRLYALGAFKKVLNGSLGKKMKDKSKVNVLVEHIYLDWNGEVAPNRFVMKQVDELEKEWKARTEIMLSDTKFPARPGSACHFCRFSGKKGGPCKHG